MNVLGNPGGGCPARVGKARWYVAAVLTGALAAGCDHPFQPFQENEDAVFSMFGYLDLKADTQWVRVMPVRQNLLLDPEPIDAVVTLEHLGSGRTVTLNDSLFAFADPRLESVAYAYNFWTTEPLEPGASYRLRAVRSDGVATTAVVDMPPDLEFSFLNDILFFPDVALLHVRAEHVVFVEVVYTVSDALFGLPAVPVRVREPWSVPTDDPGMKGFRVRKCLPPPSPPCDALPRDLRNEHRQEIRLAVARHGWPYHAELADAEVALPGVIPSNVQNGVGFVGGLATWTVPFHLCEALAPRADREHACALLFNAQSASIAGRIVREPCGEPHALADVHLTERFADGGAVVRTWKTGWNGEYRFEGIEPGAELVLELSPGAPVVHLPRLAPGERHTLTDVSVSVTGGQGCS